MLIYPTQKHLPTPLIMAYSMSTEIIHG